MKKLLIIFGLIIFPVLAQEVTIDTFSENNPNLVFNNKPKNFKGGALVYIQGISDKPQPETWMDEMKIKLFGSMEIPNNSYVPHLDDTSSFPDDSTRERGIITTNFFGHTKEIKYVNHTSDWNFIIQPMDNDSVSIQESIQFVITEDMPLLRSWPLFSQQNISFMSIQIDGKYISLNKENTQLNFESLKPGLHKILLNYVLYYKHDKNFILPLISNSWPLVIDNFSGIILNGKTGVKNPQFLLGNNNLEIPQNFDFNTDEQGNIFFKNNHILPAFTQIQLSGEQNDLAPYQNNIPFSMTKEILFCISFTIILIYFILSALEIYFLDLSRLLKRFKKISTNPIICWFYRCGEITIGSIFLLFLTFLSSYIFQIFLPFYYLMALFLLIVICIICTDMYILYPRQALVHKMHKNKEEQ